MTNIRKINRNKRKQANKRQKSLLNKQLKKQNTLYGETKDDYNWDTLNEMHQECARTVLKNNILIREVLKHPDLKDAEEKDVQRVISVTARVSNELNAQLTQIQTHTEGKSGELSMDVHSSDFDTALVVFDLYDNLSSSIVEQYASITDTLYVLKHQLQEMKNDITTNE